jgi:phosphate acetyltransferase
VNQKAIFIAATGQNVGKTTTCLGLVAGLKKRYSSVGFLKPIGQEHIEIDTGAHVDKDVVLFKSHFHLRDSCESMSPVLFPRGFTRDYLDGKVHHADLIEKISHSFLSITQKHPITVIEGTGHTGVGSIVNLNNAQVAAFLKCPMILIGSGGLGSSFDELFLNFAQCEKYGVRIAGVILNRVLDEKREMIIEYMRKALGKLGIPLLGCIPYDAFLSTPTMYDFEQLFQTTLLTGEKHKLRHFDLTRLISSPIETYQTTVSPNQLIIASASREDLVLAILSRYWELKTDFVSGLILTGKTPPKASLIEQIEKADIPMLYVPMSHLATIKMLDSHTAKIKKDDTAKIEEAIRVVEKYIDFDRLIEAIN